MNVFHEMDSPGINRADWMTPLSGMRNRYWARTMTGWWRMSEFQMENANPETAASQRVMKPMDGLRNNFIELSDW